MKTLFPGYALSKKIYDLGGATLSGYWFYVDEKLTAKIENIFTLKDGEYIFVENAIPAYTVKELSEIVQYTIKENLDAVSSAEILIEVLLKIKNMR